MPLPGGTCAEHDKDPPIKNEDMVPVFFHESTPVVAQELGHALQASAIIDLSAGSGAWCMVAIRNRCPYVGICHTECHKDLLTRRLVSLTLEGMVDSNDDLYDVAYTNELQQARASVEGSSAPIVASGGSNPAPVPSTAPVPSPAPAPSNPAPAAGNPSSREELLRRLMGQV